MTQRLPQVCLIFAVDENNVVGKNNDIPWRSSSDFRHFKSTTLGYNAIMGRKTWESLPTRPLPGRDNYVISSNPDYDAPGAIVITSLEEAITKCQTENPSRMIYVIGGKRVWEEAASKYATTALISRIGVKTDVDDTCVMAPDLPHHEVVESYVLFAGDDKQPPVRVETVVFSD